MKFGNKKGLMIAGFVARDADFKYVGEKSTPID